ncbi:alpha/beta hydrolase fold domain-containing protein [Streptomyces sp. NPDC005098]|uniref:alpha/beta hydrolase fold domain-containing protein n=1 Tax=Streptomyces sp. NPDC005098 TaxID=3154560 RepID=UPI0033A4B4A5
MSEEQRAALDQLLRNGPLDIGGDVHEQRPLLDALMTSHPLPDDVTTTTGVLGGIPVVTIELSGLESDGVILYFHGGGYALGTATAAAGLASELARRAGTRAVSVDYRLAPENPYPAALDDAVATYRGLLDGGIPASRIALAGESAGAGLAAATLVALKGAGLPQPCAAVLLSPWVDLTLSGASVADKAALDPALTPDGLRLRATEYLATADAADPLASPVFADLTGLAPLLIQAGSHEILLDDATRLAARAAAAHLPVTLDVTPGVPHVFQGFTGILDDADAALTRIGTFLRSHLAVK